MSLATILAPAKVRIAIVLRLEQTEALAHKIAASWEQLSPHTIFDTDAESVTGVDHIIVVDTDVQYYNSISSPQDAASSRYSFIRYSTDEQLFESLVSQVTVSMITALVGQYQMFHAAALGDASTGRALALVAESGTGKTTASKFLGQHLTYLTDETVIVGDDYTITPYLKPLSVIVDPARPKEQISPQDAGLKTPVDGEDFRLSHLIVLARDKSENYTEPRLVPLKTADALLAITPQTSGMAKTERGLEKLLELFAHCGGVVRLEYSEISEALPLLQGLLNGKSQIAPHQPEHTETVYASGLQPAEGELVQAESTSGHRLDDRVLLMHETQLTEVSFFAGDIWFELAQPLTREALKTRLEKLYEQEIPVEAIDENIEELVKLGALTRG